MNITAIGSGKRALKFGVSLVAITVIAMAVLWSFYAFEYQARPDGLQLLAKTVEPDFQVRAIPSIEQKLADK